MKCGGNTLERGGGVSSVVGCLCVRAEVLQTETSTCIANLPVHAISNTVRLTHIISGVECMPNPL